MNRVKRKGGGAVQRGRAPMRQPAAVPAGAESSGVGDLVELEQSDLGAVADEIGIEDKLRTWAARENVEAMTVRTYVYKYESPTSGDLKVLCDRIDEDIPDPHTVGLLYGSGRYLMIVSIPSGENQQQKCKGLRFRLHARYDELKAKAAAGQLAGPAAAVAAPVPARSAFNEGIEAVRAVVSLLTPLLEARQPQGVPDISRMMESNYDAMNTILRKSLSQSQDLIAEVNRVKLENAGGGDVEDEPDFIEKIGPLLDRFLPLLLGGGTGGAAAASAVKALPEFAKVVNNQQELSRVVAYLDKAQGKERTDAVLKALRVRRPGTNGKVKPLPAGVSRGR